MPNTPNPYLKDGTAYYPIIYVRGYAMTPDLIDASVDDPFTGFNTGSSRYRQDPKGELEKVYFESALIRLLKEHDYSDVYRDGHDLESEHDLPADHPGRVVYICKYYEMASSHFGAGEGRSIDTYADFLRKEIERLRSLLGKVHADYRKHFRVCLVAHSMGGLIVRSCIQKHIPQKGVAGIKDARKLVDKVYTYGTPHRGIEVRLLGNAIGIDLFDISNFERDNMKKFLGMSKNLADWRVNELNGKFAPDRCFSLIGTNHQDYDVKISRMGVGPLSDGLVRIQNAYVARSPRAFVHRAHGGPFGIVNSEEGYQNLSRFLFGDMRAEGILRFRKFRFPGSVATKLKDKKKVDGNLYTEVSVTPRGTHQWFLTRRDREHGSAIRDSLWRVIGKGRPDLHPNHLFSTFLSTDQIQRRDDARRSRASELRFAIEIVVSIDRYEVAGWGPINDIHATDALYRSTIYIDVENARDQGKWVLKAREGDPEAEPVECPIHIDQGTVTVIVELGRDQPHHRLEADLELTITPWA